MNRGWAQHERPGSEVHLHLRLSRNRKRRGLRPSPDSLESRALLSGDSPTDLEQYYLEWLDDARFNPAAYGVSLGIDLSGVSPAQPLAMNPLLVEAARGHSQDMIAEDYFSHTSPDGDDPGDRIAATGLVATGWAESIETDTEPVTGSASSFATWEVGYSLSNLIVDQGVPDLGHRIMLLDIGGLDQTMRQVGIGLASQQTTSGGYTYQQSDTTIDLAATADTGPYLTGVVFNDATGNGEYEPGEGLGGVTIAVSGVGSTTTMDAGGYAIPVSPGTYTVTASGGGLASPITRTVVVGDDNVALNFDTDPNGATLQAAPSGTVNGTLGTFNAIAAGDTAANYSARIDWGDGNATFATLTPNPGGTFSVEGSNTYVSPGVYAVRVLVTHLSDGQTLAINATVVVNSSTDTGPSFPSPAYPGEGTGSGTGSATQGGSGSVGDGTGTTTTGHGRHHKKHAKVRHAREKLTHAVGKHPAARRPAQRDETLVMGRRVDARLAP